MSTGTLRSSDHGCKPRGNGRMYPVAQREISKEGGHNFQIFFKRIFSRPNKVEAH